MFTYPSLKSRLLASSLYGLLIGCLSILAAYSYFENSDPIKSYATLLWTMSFCWTIGLCGVVTWIPLINRKLPWYIRGSSIGLVISLMIILLQASEIEMILKASMMPVSSPYWLIPLYGSLGFITEATATYFGGEGPITIIADQERINR